jgi:hypothetical protein
MRGLPWARDHRRMGESLGSIGVALSPLAVPVTMLGQPPALPIPEAADPDTELAWQSSIGQFIFLQSLVHDRI